MRTKFLHIILFMLTGFVSFGQVTTSTVSGLIADTKGEALIGATVVAIHEPSGSTYSTISREDGRFNLPGMRVGGPYTLSASYVGYQEMKVSNLF